MPGKHRGHTKHFPTACYQKIDSNTVLTSIHSKLCRILGIMNTSSSNDETSSCSSEAESPACATSSLPINIEKDDYFHYDTSNSDRIASETEADESLIHPSMVGDDGNVSEDTSLPTPISSNDEQQEHRGYEISQDQEEDFDTQQSDRDVESGSYTISIASVAGGNKVCNVNLPRFSLMVVFAFVLGTFLLVFWLTENDA